MRITEFWENMAETFGRGYAESVAADQTLPQLDGKTVNEALRGDWDAKQVWIAVCQAYGDRVPDRIRRLSRDRTLVRYSDVRTDTARAASVMSQAGSTVTAWLRQQARNP